MTVYPDTSFLVSIYIADSHSSVADRLIASGPRVLVIPLHFAEWAHAVSQQVFRGQISPSAADQIHRAFGQDCNTGLWTQASLPERAFEVCAGLARRHGSKLGTRTLDSLHVACALELNAEQFWTFDDRQAKLAKAEGLKIK